ncbi:S8 family peptidase [Candidatus Thiodiazotropha sp. CDECU1]|uniref:S8 family peptidase n=1 Tax=Candidatus Thiodiazotropha sp. CDECU1 TaxID=3065865 RepID=UPI00292DF0D4|nr:S8 family peptidase [Candidatus Thiodiazotropha sp. CDECU1]
MIRLEKLTITGLSLVVASMIAACGGGGGGGDNVDTQSRVNVSGNLVVPSFVVTDSDVNDVETVSVPNHPATAAQVVPNPVNIGGYVNQPREGFAGLSFNSGDTDDYFLIDMQAGQTLLLNIADLSSGEDLDLFLFDLNGQLIDASLGGLDTKFESLVIPEDGQYYVNVYAVSGASNYLLSVGLTPLAALPSGALRLSDDFLPEEVLVRFNDLSVQARIEDSLLQQFQFDTDNYSGGVQRLTLKEQAAVVAARTLTDMQLTDLQQQKLDTLHAIKALRKRDDVDYAEPNYIVHPSAIPNDEHYTLQWHYPQINLPQAWDITTGDTDVIVAVIDTGVLLTHPEMSGQLTAGYDFISDAESAGDGDGIDSDPNDEGDALQDGTSSSFHGTHVAGTVAARSNNSQGAAGVAWESRIMPIRVLGKDGGNSLDLAEGIRYAAGLSNASGTTPAQPADIINMSLGGNSDSQTTREAVAAARAEGVIIIAASGNESTSQLSYPASYPGVVSVSAVDINRDLAFYSNFGTMIDVAAPGGDLRVDLNGDSRPDGILSAGADDSSDTLSYQLVFYNGTSMAAPHIAGVAALMKAVYPAMTPAEFDSMLAAGELTTDLGDTGRDNLYGHGLIDAFKAVDAAQQRGGGGVPVDPALSVNPQSLNFSHNLQSTTLFIEQIGGDLGSVQIAEDISWLTLQASQVDGSGYGSYNAIIDRSGLAAGTYSDTIQISAGSASETVQVIMQVLDISISGDAGIHYVLLVNNDTDQVLQQFQVEAVGESVSYSFSEVAAGDYLIFAGSDMDMDGIICDSGESCGAYATASQPSIITIESSDIVDLDFTTSYEYQSPSSQSLENTTRSLVLRRLDVE